jgi:hypothetical protein
VSLVEIFIGYSPPSSHLGPCTSASDHFLTRTIPQQEILGEKQELPIEPLHSH